MEFCRKLVFLERRLIRFDDRPYLPQIYAAQGRYLVLRCSRQTEKSTFLVNTMLQELCLQPGRQILFVSPRLEQARAFIRGRLIPAIEQSPLIRRSLLGTRALRLPVTDLRFANDSGVAVRAAYLNADSSRGLSAQLLMVDEFQDIAPGVLPILEECMSHFPHKRTILTGTPKSIDNHLEAVFNRTTANEWTIDCDQCGQAFTITEHALGPFGLICPKCSAPADPRTGRWVPRHPLATAGEGFCVNHLMTPWTSYADVLGKLQDYNIGAFKNEVLGLPTTIGDQVVTREELEACCRDVAMAASLGQVTPRGRAKLIAGVDWGGGVTSRTVLVIGFFHPDKKFQLVYMQRFAPTEHPDTQLNEVARRCAEFQVRFVAADGAGNGSVLNRMLVDRLHRRIRLFGINYAMSNHPPRADGALTQFTIDRTASLGTVFTLVKKQMLLFPRLEDSRTFLEEFACETAEFDDANRTVTYSKPETMQDDALHATNYALVLARYIQSAQHV